MIRHVPKKNHVFGDSAKAKTAYKSYKDKIYGLGVDFYDCLKGACAPCFCLNVIVDLNRSTMPSYAIISVTN